MSAGLVAALPNILVAVNTAITLVGRAAEYQAMVAKAIAEGRDITDDELRAASAKLGAEIERGEEINRTLPG